MIGALLLASGLSLGAGGVLSSGLGEQDAAPELLVRVESSAWRFEADWSPSDKVTPGRSAGWLGGVAVDRRAGPLLVGLAYRHRAGDGWRKETVWLHAGWHIVTEEGIEVRLLADSALTSRDRESSIRAALTLPLAPHLALEPEARVLFYDQGAYQAQRRIGYVVSLRLLWAFASGG